MKRLAWRLLSGCLLAVLAACTGPTASTATPVKRFMICPGLASPANEAFVDAFAVFPSLDQILDFAGQLIADLRNASDNG